tara:strand:- start:6079 stop:8418 length:2340 start_codon:yes stop_codon:yes gene_type:complete
VAWVVSHAAYRRQVGGKNQILGKETMLNTRSDDSAATARPVSGSLDRAETRARMRPLRNGDGHIVFSLPGIKCGGCVSSIERALNARDDVVSVRVNLTLRQASVTLAGSDADPALIVDDLAKLGFDAVPTELSDGDSCPDDATGRLLLRAMAIAGFGAANIMLLSVGVWSGAQGQTRDTFHLVSAMIAVPVVIYAGRPFFVSALNALRAGRTNMDVPITLGVILALVLSLTETVRGGEHVFFDASVTLLFFLLAGRYLDHLMRERARSAVTGLARLIPRGAMVRQNDGRFAYVRLTDVAPDAILSVGPNEPLPTDAVVVAGATDIDRSLVSGEAMPVTAKPGDTLEAGTLNLTGRIEVRVLRSAGESFLAQMMHMQAAAENGREGYVRIADRVARLYAPVVHILALATFAGWMIMTGGDWQASAFVAISVLIITCPCALGLAVPVTHVVAAGRLMRMGVLMKDGAALERLAAVDRVVFDKTGTITTGTPIVGVVPSDPGVRSAVKALALHSVHPAARAIVTSMADRPAHIHHVTEVPGFGIQGSIGGRRARLGRADWVAEIANCPCTTVSPAFSFEGDKPISFGLTETLRPGAKEAVAMFERSGVPVTMLSGDIADRAHNIAGLVGISDVRHSTRPAEKIAMLDALRGKGHRTLMVGDGLNDTGALAAAYVSMTPASGSDAGRTAANFVFLRDRLDAVPVAWQVARDTAVVVRQNFALAIAYNCIAIPLAAAGMVTPLIAALAMSGSSIVVTLNALRLNKMERRGTRAAASRDPVQVPA